MNAAVSALRFFFGVTLGRDDARTGMTTVREPRKLPVVLSPKEVARLLDAAPGPKYKAALGLAYGAGLPIEIPQVGDAISVGGVRLSVIGPLRRYASSNDEGIVVVAEVGELKASPDCGVAFHNISVNRFQKSLKPLPIRKALRFAHH